MTGTTKAVLQGLAVSGGIILLGGFCVLYCMKAEGQPVEIRGFPVKTAITHDDPPLESTVRRNTVVIPVSIDSVFQEARRKQKEAHERARQGITNDFNPRKEGGISFRGGR